MEDRKTKQGKRGVEDGVVEGHSKARRAHRHHRHVSGGCEYHSRSVGLRKLRLALVGAPGRETKGPRSYYGDRERRPEVVVGVLSALALLGMTSGGQE